MRAMETMPAASLNLGMEQRNRSLAARRCGLTGAILKSRISQCAPWEDGGLSAIKISRREWKPQ